MGGVQDLVFWLVFGVFEVIGLPDNEFKGWQKSYPFQVKLKPVAVPKGGIEDKALQSRILLQKANGGSANLMELSEKEFNRILGAIKGEIK